MTAHEVRLAIALGVPVNGTPPHLWPLGFKSAGRRLFSEAGVPTPIGVEDVHDARELAAAVESIRRARPDLAAVVVKHDDSGAGDGNLVLPTVTDGEQVAACDLGAEFLRRAPDWFVQDLTQGGIVEELMRGEAVTSPSAQIDIGADGSVRVLSTHEQVLGGENGQVFVGCRFPADATYAGTLARHAKSIGAVLARRGVLGRVAVDFVAIRRRGAWDVVALELNLRRGGTTHPYTVLRHMVPGSYDEATGQWIIEDGTTRCYRADDNRCTPTCSACSGPLRSAPSRTPVSASIHRRKPGSSFTCSPGSRWTGASGSQPSVATGMRRRRSMPGSCRRSCAVEGAYGSAADEEEQHAHAAPLPRPLPPRPRAGSTCGTRGSPAHRGRHVVHRFVALRKSSQKVVVVTSPAVNGSACWISTSSIGSGVPIVSTRKVSRVSPFCRPRSSPSGP